MAAITTQAAAAHRLIPEINAHYREFKKSSQDALSNAIAIGEKLWKVKESLPHGEFLEAVEQRCDFTIRWGQVCMKLAESLPPLLKLLDQAAKPNTIEEALEFIKDHAPPKVVKSAAASALLKSTTPNEGSTSENDRPQAKPGSNPAVCPEIYPDPGEAADSKVAAGREARTSEGTLRAPEGGSNPPATASGEDERTDSQGSEPVKETDPRPPRSGKEKPGTGTCPCCTGKKWVQDEFGFTCAKCHHPWGEVADVQIEEQQGHAGTLREKTRKTMEAAMRCFDDLNTLIPKAGAHKQAIELCKNLLKSAKSWK